MIEVLIGVGIVWGSQLVGALVRRMKRPKPLEPVKPVCECQHPKSLHKDGTGACQGGFSDFGKPVNHEGFRRCRCTHYNGPQPYPEFYAPELTP